MTGVGSMSCKSASHSERQRLCREVEESRPILVERKRRSIDPLTRRVTQDTGQSHVFFTSSVTYGDSFPSMGSIRTFQAFPFEGKVGADGVLKNP